MTGDRPYRIMESKGVVTMLDAKDLEAIAKLMDEKISVSETRMMAYMEEKINASQAQTAAMMEAYFEPRFKLLGEQLSLFRETKAPVEALDALESRADVLEAVVREHSREIELLKKAQ